MSDPSQTAAFEAPEIEEIARLFPNYDIIRLIACGGMGAVYEATQRSLDRQVAIKVLPREFSADQAFREGFESEAKAMAKMNHPNLIGVYDFGEADGMLFIVMEYVAGNSLFAASHGVQVDPAVAISIIEAICHGLSDAHDHGILHRDIKPGNILLDQATNPKIGDFGLARALEREIEDGEQIFGTPGYTAPEVLEPPYTIDQRADIFSVGVMLHELLTGLLPDADRRPASQICGCSFRLDAVIRKATHKDPNQRYASCKELAEALAKITALKVNGGLVSGASTASSALRAPGKYVPPKPVKSSSGLGFLVFILVVAAAVAYFAMNRDSIIQQPIDPAESPAETTATPTPTPVPDPAPTKTADSSTSANGFDSQELIDRLRRDINRDIEAVRTSNEKERLEDNTKYKERLMALVESMDDEERDAATDFITGYIEEVNGDSKGIPKRLPAELKDIPGSEAVHTKFIGMQRKSHLAIQRKIRECKSYYLLELEHEIAKHVESASAEELAVLQDELDRVKNDEGYFQDSVLD
ncbi:MAG: serine/threonine-protein kinase [Luteolibacter sp.]